MRAKVLVSLALAALLVPLAALPAGSAVLCFGRAPTIYATPGVPTNGTAGADVILGTAGNDVIRGLGGGDRICGLGGNDTLEGGAGPDRIDGGAGHDIVRGGAGSGNVLKGGPGNDGIVAVGPGDSVHGGRGRDTIDARATSLSVLRGGAGADRIQSGYRSDLDGGPGVDHCGLGLGVAGSRCETVELLCGTGGELPLFGKPNLTSARGDFDGNGVDDTLYVWGILADWRAQIETDGGYRARVALPQTNGAAALGGHDLNGDGVDEAFIKLGGSATRDVVGLYTLYEPVGSPATGLACGLAAVSFPDVASPAPPTAAVFFIGDFPLETRGLVCLPDGSLRELRQSIADPTHYTQRRYDYPYLPGFGAAPPGLGTPAFSEVTLAWPADQAAILQGSAFTCGSLSLEPPPPEF